MLKNAVTKEDHIRGVISAPLILVEYGDFECPYCGEAYYYLQEIRKTLGDRLALVFRQFPLREEHPNAERAAEASEAAASQGKFWEMHDILFENQKYLSRNNLLEYAKGLGLNMQEFNLKLKNHVHRSLIDESIATGEKSGVEGTPTFFINNQIYSGPSDEEALLIALQNAL